MLVIGITGPSGAGKGTAGEIFEKHGIVSLDTDKIYHELLVPPSDCLNELVENFGEIILNEDLTLNREKLSRIVFAEKNSKELLKLNEITHKYVLDEVRKRIKQREENGDKMIIVDAPALVESGFDKECQKIICVLAAKSARINRIMFRDNKSLYDTKLRLDAQKDDKYYISVADYVIYNDGDISSLTNDIESIISKLEALV